jgi:hypothetical protein
MKSGEAFAFLHFSQFGNLAHAGLGKARGKCTFSFCIWGFYFSFYFGNFPRGVLL